MASGQTLLSFVPESREYLSGYSPQARLMVRNLRTALEFPRVTSGNLYLACFTGIVPYHYDGGGFNFGITYATKSEYDYSDLVGFDIAVESLAAGVQSNSTGFGAAKTGAQVSNVSGQTNRVEIAFSASETGNLVAGNLFRFYLIINIPGIDSLTNSVHVLAIDIEEV